MLIPPVPAGCRSPPAVGRTGRTTATPPDHLRPGQPHQTGMQIGPGQRGPPPNSSQWNAVGRVGIVGLLIGDGLDTRPGIGQRTPAGSDQTVQRSIGIRGVAVGDECVESVELSNVTTPTKDFPNRQVDYRANSRIANSIRSNSNPESAGRRWTSGNDSK